MKLYEANQTNEALSTGSFIHLLSSEMILFLHEILKFGVTDLGGRGLSNGGGILLQPVLPYGLQGGAGNTTLPGICLSFLIAEENQKDHL